MKGMLNFLERAGLVKLDESAKASEDDTAVPAEQPTEPGPDAPPVVLVPPSVMAPPNSVEDAAANPRVLDFGKIYADACVPESRYPAERLLRVLDGLSTLDEATRITTIKAIDVADESWTIADPVKDASLKAQALSNYAQQVQGLLQQRERATQARLEALRVKKEETLGSIRKQISDLEALAAREEARNAKESSELTTGLDNAKERTALELAELQQMQQRLLGLATQFQSSTANI